MSLFSRSNAIRESICNLIIAVLIFFVDRALSSYAAHKKVGLDNGVRFDNHSRYDRFVFLYSLNAVELRKVFGNICYKNNEKCKDDENNKYVKQ